MNTKVMFSSASPHWSTPQALYEELDREFHFDFDPYPLKGFDTSNLRTDAWGSSNFVNPPYGQKKKEIEKSLKRCISQRERAVFLLPARTDTKWFHELILPHAAEIRFIKGRLRFNGSKNSAPFPSMLVIFK